MRLVSTFNCVPSVLWDSGAQAPFPFRADAEHWGVLFARSNTGPFPRFRLKNKGPGDLRVKWINARGSMLPARVEEGASWDPGQAVQLVAVQAVSSAIHVSGDWWMQGSLR